MKIRYIFALAAIAALTGCSKDETPAVNGESRGVFTASVESSEATRTELGVKEGQSYPTLWLTGDAIAVTNGTVTGKYSTQDSGKEVADFAFVSGTDLSIGAGNVYAYYPYDGFGSHAGDVFGATLPAVQNYLSGNIDNGAYPMVAVSADSNLKFHNVCGIIRLQLLSAVAGLSVESIHVTAGIPVSGAASVTYNGTGEPSVACTGSPKIELSCGAGVPLNGAYTDFHIVLPPSETGYEGLTFTVNFTDGRVQVFTANTPIKVERSSITTISLAANNPVILTRATLKSGSDVNAAMKTLAAGSPKTDSNTDNIVKAVRFAAGSSEVKQAGETEIQDDASQYPVYAGWDAATETITIRTPADILCAPMNAARMFYDFKALTDVDVASLNTSETTDMSYMFGACIALTSLDLSAFDTSNVTTMQNMVYNSDSLASVDFSSFDTSKVVDFSNMLSGASYLASVNLGPRFVFPEGSNFKFMFSSAFGQVSRCTITCNAGVKAALLAESTFDKWATTFVWNIVE